MCSRRTERRTGPFDRRGYRERNRLKPDRRGATRYEKRAAYYPATVSIATILLGP